MTLFFSACFLQKAWCPIFQKAGCPIFKNSGCRLTGRLGTISSFKCLSFVQINKLESAGQLFSTLLNRSLRFCKGNFSWLFIMNQMKYPNDQTHLTFSTMHLFLGKCMHPVDQRPSIYHVSKGLGGWVQKMASFANVQYLVYAYIVGGSKKSKIMLT